MDSQPRQGRDSRGFLWNLFPPTNRPGERLGYLIGEP